MASEAQSSRETRKTSLSQTWSRHVQQQSEGSLSVEELTPDDMAYDADVETIKPDQYEEPESEAEDEDPPHHSAQSLDEELAARMRRLGREQFQSLRSSSERGRKRRSFEMDYDGDANNNVQAGPRWSPDLEVQELVDSPDVPSPAKRRREQSKRPQSAHDIIRRHNGDQQWHESQHRTRLNR